MCAGGADEVRHAAKVVSNTTVVAMSRQTSTLAGNYPMTVSSQMHSFLCCDQET